VSGSEFRVAGYGVELRVTGFEFRIARFVNSSIPQLLNSDT